MIRGRRVSLNGDDGVSIVPPPPGFGAECPVVLVVWGCGHCCVVGFMCNGLIQHYPDNQCCRCAVAISSPPHIFACVTHPNICLESGRSYRHPGEQSL